MAQHRDLFVGQHGGRSAEGYEIDQSRNLKGPQFVSQGDVHKDVSGKQRELDPVAAVVPAVYRFV
jgi:hypothetical protein